MTIALPRATMARVVRVAVSFGLLIGVGWLLGLGEIAVRLRQMQMGWVGLALTISVLQVAASAWRWRFTAGRLGIDLPLSDAIREYYLAMFLNQVTPGGMMGDVSRAWRHARSRSSVDAPAGPAVRAVILERASGQVAMAVVASLSLAVLPASLGVIRWAALGGCVAVVGGLGLWTRGRRARVGSLLGRFWGDAQAALLGRTALPVQLASSGVVVATYLVTYLVAARAVGIDTSWLVLLPLVAPVLVAMLIPVTVAGWGVREGAAALLWGAVGLTAVDGVAISVAYGLVVFLSTLPGGVVLALGPSLRG